MMRRIALAVLALCMLAPLVAAAHGNHGQPNGEAQAGPVSPLQPAAFDQDEAGGDAIALVAPIAPAAAVTPPHCPGEKGPGCGCHGHSCTRTPELALIDARAPWRAVPLPAASVLLPLGDAPAASSAPFTLLPSRAPPVFS